MTGVSNVFRINLENKKAEVITNSETGMFRPIPIANDSIMAYYYSKSGFVPVMFRLDTFCNATSINYLGMKALQNNPELKKWNLPSFSKIVIDKSVISEKSYNSFNNLKLRYMIPVAEGYKDFPAYGLKFKFIDDIYINLIDISFLYSPNPLIPAKERFHSNLKFNYLEWELIGTYNKTDFYDLLGPIKRSRAGYSLSIEYHDYFMYNRKPENADYKIKVFYAGDLQSLPEYQNVNVSTDKLISAIINFNYSFLRKSLGAVDDEQGVDYKLYLSTVAVDNFVIPKIFWEGSFGRLLPFRNSSFWLRLYGGKSFGETSSPYNYFYFGGFGNNYMDMYKICRFRESESFPGLKINEIGSEAFIKSTIEINLPPIRFRKFGFLPFYFTYSRLSIFASGLLLGNQDFSYTTRALSVGCQIDFELSLFYLMKTYLSFGYAMASLENQRATDEFMISLKF